jgi:predicted PurR-regulated permease PerM
MEKIETDFILGTILVFCMVYLNYSFRRRPLIERYVSAFFLIVFLMIYIPILFLIIYHEEVVGVTNGIGAAKGKSSHSYIMFTYKYKNKFYERGDMPWEKEIYRYSSKGSRFVVLVNPWFPSRGKMDFSRPVPDSTEVLSK